MACERGRLPYRGAMPLPSALEIELFRAVEDVHELTGAIVVLLVDAEGRSVAVSGDEDDLPPSLRAILSGRHLAAAGSVRELLSPIAGELVDSRLNVTILDVDGSFVLAIAFDTKAELDVVQSVGGQARAMIAELVATTRAGDDAAS
jgi:hypothetical protein